MRSGSKPPGPRIPVAAPKQAPRVLQRPIRELSYEERIQALEDECASLSASLRELVTKLVGTSASTGALLRHEQLIGDLRRDVKQLQDNEARRAVQPSRPATNPGIPAPRPPFQIELDRMDPKSPIKGLETIGPGDVVDMNAFELGVATESMTISNIGDLVKAISDGRIIPRDKP